MWDYGDGLTDTTVAVTHTHFYSLPGTYTVTLTAYNPYTVASLARAAYITVYDVPVPAFSASPRMGPVPLTVTFDNQSTNATSYLWSFGDGATSTVVAPLHVYSMTGEYTVTLTAYNPYSSATVTETRYITVYYMPTVDFVGTPTIGTAPLVVTFTRSTSHANSFLWDYGDGITSTTADTTHQHTYTAPGVYTVSLTAANVFTSVTNVRPGYMLVYAPPMPKDYYIDAIHGSNISGDGTPTKPWRTITYGLSRVTGDNITLHVTPGLYDEALGESFPITMKPDVRIMGAGYTTTTIAGNDSAFVIHFPNTVIYTETTVLSGFKITNGSEGVHVDGHPDRSSPTIQGNWITGNYDGIGNHSGYSCQTYSVIKDNLISNNIRFGIYNVSDSGNNSGTSYTLPTIDSNRIVNNGNAGIYCYAYGWSGIDGAHCSPVITNNLISNNGGSGEQCDVTYAGQCHTRLVGNTIANNQGWGVQHSQGPYEYWTTNSPQLINNLIYGNASGGAVFFPSDEPLLLNNTIADNYATGVARLPSMYGIRDGWPTIVNSIIWEHSDDISNVPVDRVSYSDTGDSTYWGANHNIWNNPDFLDPLHGNYRVAPTSPVIDAGNSAHPNLPSTDLDGHPRIAGAAADMGAYEYSALAVNQQADPNPVSAGAQLTYTIRVTNTGSVDLHATITDTLPAHVTPSGILTWTPTIPVPGGVWSQTVVVTVEMGYTGMLTNHVQVTTLEGITGENSLVINVIGHKVYLPLVTR